MAESLVPPKGRTGLIPGCLEKIEYVQKDRGLCIQRGLRSCYSDWLPHFLHIRGPLIAQLLPQYCTVR